MKSKWSRLALSTHSTSSNSRASQLDGVRRVWARPGAQTITLRSVPTSECTPNFTSFALAIMSPIEVELRFQLDANNASSESVDARHRADDRYDEDRPVAGQEYRLVPLPPRHNVQQRAGRVKDGREQKELHAAGVDHENRIHHRNGSHDQVALASLGFALVGFPALGNLEPVSRHEQVGDQRHGTGETQHQG